MGVCMCKWYWPPLCWWTIYEVPTVSNFLFTFHIYILLFLQGTHGGALVLVGGVKERAITLWNKYVRFFSIFTTGQWDGHLAQCMCDWPRAPKEFCGQARICSYISVVQIHYTVSATQKWSFVLKQTLIMINTEGRHVSTWAGESYCR